MKRGPKSMRIYLSMNSMNRHGAWRDIGMSERKSRPEKPSCHQHFCRTTIGSTDGTKCWFGYLDGFGGKWEQLDDTHVSQ